MAKTEIKTFSVLNKAAKGFNKGDAVITIVDKDTLQETTRLVSPGDVAELKQKGLL